jgi:hypothetical protein
MKCTILNVILEQLSIIFKAESAENFTGQTMLC